MIRGLWFVTLVAPAASLLGLALGGGWVWLGVAAIAFVYGVIEPLVGRDVAPLRTLPVWMQEAILYAQPAAVVLGWVLAARFMTTGPSAFEIVGAVLSLTYLTAGMGTVAAHELVHRTESALAREVGRVALAFSADGAFAIEHVYGHHRTVATIDDPATARRGETIYDFLVRSTIGQRRRAWSFETARLGKLGRPAWSLENAVLRGDLYTLVVFAAMFALGGWAAIGLGLVVAALSKASLETINYVEHYGLARAPGQRVQPRHSWDADNRLGVYALFALPRHADHHARAQKRYWELNSEPAAPKLPMGYLHAQLLSLVPPLWFAVIAPHLERWDRDLAAPGEADLARARLDISAITPSAAAA